jgi:hypothetical protein
MPNATLNATGMTIRRSPANVAVLIGAHAGTASRAARPSTAPSSGASGTLDVTLTTMPSARPTTAPIAIAARTLRA